MSYFTIKANTKPAMRGGKEIFTLTHRHINNRNVLTSLNCPNLDTQKHMTTYILNKLNCVQEQLYHNQWQEVKKYIHSDTVLKYSSGVLLLNSRRISC